MPTSTKTSRIEWICKPYTNLSPEEQIAVIKLRSEVNADEELFSTKTDFKDHVSYQLCGWYGRSLVATVRLLPSGAYHKLLPSIGPICIAVTHRGIGLSRELMNRAVEECERLFGKQDIHIAAEVCLMKFYESLGFKAVTEENTECGSPHLDMLYRPETSQGTVMI